MNISRLPAVNNRINTNQKNKNASSSFYGHPVLGDSIEISNHETIKNDRRSIIESCYRFLGLLPAASKNLQPHIDFIEAESIQDGEIFGKKNLGIKKYKGFKDDDLDILNWVNEGLVNVNNAAKGRAVMPKKVIISDPMALYGAAMSPRGELLINRTALNLYKKGSAPFKEIMRQLGEECRKNPDKEPMYTSAFSLISHEMGHLQHQNSLGMVYKPLLILSEDFGAPSGKYGRKAAELKAVFDKSKDIAGKVSKYASYSPVEFTAECYAKMIDGIELDDDVIELYKKLGGAML